MTFRPARIQHLVQEHQLVDLFVDELGWDHHSGTLEIEADGNPYALTAVAEKRLVVVWRCGPGPDGAVAPRAARQKIERQVTRHTYEHLIIFEDGARTEQIWQWVLRVPGEPARYREYAYRRGQSGEQIVQNLRKIAFTLSDEESIDLRGVVTRLRDTFDRDKVTKRFYDDFRTEHRQFLAFIDGIAEVADREWYASLMLNRLMFVYFIQQKGFLANDPDYLQHRLEQVRTQRGRGQFYTFYRYFLRRLFHEGFGRQPEHRAPDLEALLGDVPYLNGGLFEPHELEDRYPAIDIADEAFEHLFDFFGQWQWHLDDRLLAKGNEINPDVLGYIFEKYINQKQMGAYYTKEDITGYISKSTIIPHLFDEARKHCAIAFEPAAAVWRLLQRDPDRYIYEPVRRGVVRPDGTVVPETDLPDFVQVGMHDPKARMFDRRYNLGAAKLHDADGNALTLPTETWREYVTRRQRCLELRAKLAGGEVTDINDLVTLNLDLRQFAQDAVEQCEGPEQLRAFWKASSQVTVLDPACGSGAFLFAALNVLAPVYDACLDRMQGFVEDLDQSGEAHSPRKFEDFRRTLRDVERHPNRDYFILKSIIVNNLYGVDIMEEAVEICKLRLFLRLVAQVDRVSHLEPLPDIDFNIRAGNTLVGYVTVDEVRRAAGQVTVPTTASGTASQARMIDTDSEAAIRRIEEDAECVDRAFTQFHEMQSRQSMDAEQFAAAKRELRTRLAALADQLDHYLAREYGVDPAKKAAFEAWRKSHEPFHWFAEFYGIMRGGGFDVVLGNPPYVELTKVTGYALQGFNTAACGNLYCPMVERFARLGCEKYRLGVIVPLSVVSTERMMELREHLKGGLTQAWISCYSGDAHPSKLFEGVKFRLAILIGTGGTGFSLFTSQYLKWFAEERPVLFTGITFTPALPHLWYLGLFPKLGTAIAAGLLEKIFRYSPVTHYRNALGRTVYIHRVITMFVKCFDFIPHFSSEVAGVKKSDDYKPYQFLQQTDPDFALAVFNSSTFFYYFITLGDCFHCGREFVLGFPFVSGNPTDGGTVQLGPHGQRLMADLKANSIRKRAISKQSGMIEYDEFWPSRSKAIIDAIDVLLATHYGFTDEELDFIINYDIKYRMGADADSEDAP